MAWVVRKCKPNCCNYQIKNGGSSAHQFYTREEAQEKADEWNKTEEIHKEKNFKVLYQDESFFGKFKRFLRIRDGDLICNYCGKSFFNLCPSEICYVCWCDANDVSYY